MMWSLCLWFLGCGKPPAPLPEAPPLHDPVGDWAGQIEAPMGSKLPLVVHISADDTGGLTGTVDSPQQGAFGIPISAVAVGGDTLRVQLDSLKAVYEGRFVDADTLEGQWRQGGMKMTLNLSRNADVQLPNRPQTPQPPFPYTEEAVTVSVGDHTLAGTLTLPEGEGPFPGVVLITGSGPQDRDESLMGHKPFWILADHLGRAGVAVLRYDDRGVAESTGDFQAATSVDFGADATAALDALRARPEVDTVGFIGHSEGGLIAPLVAEIAKPDFMVLLAGPAVPIQQLMVTQAESVARAAGAPQSTLDAIAEKQPTLLATAAKGDTPENRAAVEALMHQMPGADQLNDTQRRAQLDALFTPWMVWFLRYDPTPALSSLQMPVYAVWGSLDTQVDADQNAPAFVAATQGNPDARAEVFDGLNHLFQPAQTGGIAEYGQIETTLDPAVLSKVSAWIRGVNR